MDFDGSAQLTEQSLPSLPSHLQNDTQLTAHLASRFHAHYPTARLSTQAVVALNTYTNASKGPNGDVEESAMGATRELASRAWARLGHRGENQAVVFLGESGSGKTTLRAHLLMNVLAFSSTPLSEKVSLASFVFDTLTTTKTATTQTASKAGLFLELQYDTSASMYPTLIGGKLLDHRLERSRVATVPTGERNFHMFYYLLAGTSAAEKQHLGLNSASTVAEVGNRASMAGKRWRYLGHPTQLKVGVNDAQGFQDWKTALRKLGFTTHEIADICQVLAAVMHLGQLDFYETTSTTPTADDSGGYSHEGGEKVTLVRNKEELEFVSAFLGVGAQELERSLANKTTTSRKGRDRIGVMLDPAGARGNADELARTLYSLLVAFIVEQMNEKLCAPENSVANAISIVDFPGFAYQPATGHTLDQLLNNAANEALHNFCIDSFFQHQSDQLEEEDVAIPESEYYDNSAVTKALLKPSNGLLTIIDDQQRRGKDEHGLNATLEHRFKDRDGPVTVSPSSVVTPGTNFSTPNAAAWFKVKHFAGDISYPLEGLMEQNAEVVSGDMVNLIRTTHNDFVRDLFGQDALKTVSHPSEQTAVVQATIASKPTRQPSMSRKKYQALQRSATKRKVFGEDADAISNSSDEVKNKRSRDNTSGPEQGASAQYLSSLTQITQALNAPNTNPYFIFCLKPNDRRVPNQFDSKCVRTQLQTYGIPEISQRLKIADFSIFLPFSEFLGMAESDVAIVGSEREKAELVIDDRRWPENEARAGTTGVFLSERIWLQIADLPALPQPEPGAQHSRDTAPSYGEEGHLSPQHKPGVGDSKLRLIDSQTATPGSFYNDLKGGDYFGSKELDLRSDAGASALNGDMFRGMDTKEQMGEKTAEAKMQAVDEVPVSGSRKRWLFLVYFLTWYIPDFFIRKIGRMPRKDVRIAWREKLAINMLIWLSCAFVVFFMIGLPELICPTQHVFSQAELSTHNGKDGANSYVAMRGIVYDLDSFMGGHYPTIVPQSALKKYAGTDATNLFPVQVSALCNGKDGTVDPAVQLNYKNSNYTNTNTLVSTTDTNAQYHDFRSFTNDSRPDWWWEQQVFLKANYMKGRIGFSPQYLKTLASKQNAIAILYDRVYDFTDYIPGGRQPRYPVGQDPPSQVPDSNFMDGLVVSLFSDRAGQDVTKYWEGLNMGSAEKNRMKVCLDNLFYVGDVDTRNSARCLFATYVLLAISILLVSVIGFKFLAALQFGKKNMPENLDKFVICTVPAYTEDEESLRRAIDSISRMKYDDKRKLLVVICDGMIVGQGNDRPTPRIVLDILGVSETVDPEALSFESLGEGQKQHNMGKVYSGLYEVQGHIVPFLVVVKVGKPSEVSKPGNRGKRDSQMILMRFLNRVHYNLPMTPLELEMHHQIRNIIGVNPTFYEFLFQIDADTVVAPDSATRMIASFLHDTRLIGVCGETALTNAKASFITMMQVYEYYISHNLTKAFESLFGSVTCLPGCFSMYRIRAAETGKPLFVSKEIVDAYSEIRVDTLHMKNLLHLGEDRYLTTLLLKFHSKYKTKYIFRAHAWTIAPDSWTVFMSQRRRWINSTVHNLIELIPIQQLCGFCCFSMRFVVFLDLLSTIVQPVIVGYIVYLIVLVARNSKVVPITAFILLGAIYGLQAIIFILRRKWEMIGWMLIYVAATPIFACGLPLYAFWHMDDFSWGNTRVVTGEKGQKVIVSDEGKFDPNSIPKMKWENYQTSLWEAHTQRDDRSEVSGFSYGTRSFGQSPFANGTRTPSEYGGGMHGGHSRPGSALDLRGSRLSLVQPAHQYPPGGGWSGHTSEMNLEMHDLLPSDDALLAEIRQILATSDLMTVTKKSVKRELERRFGMPLEAKRAYIGSATEAVLAGNL